MKIYCNPLNLPYKYQFVKHTRFGEKQATVYREAADPSIVLFKEKYYLFPSMTGGFFTSEDLLTWEEHPFLNKMPIYGYAPDVCVVGEYLYFCASDAGKNCSFYRTKDPEKEPFEEIKGTFPFWDPDLFLDDDGRLYFYWGCSNQTPIYGVELDRNTLKPLSEPLVMFDSDDKTRGYERSGNDHVPPKSEEMIAAMSEDMIQKIMQAPENQRHAMGLDTEEKIRWFARKINGNDPYIEGAWMTKHNGRYYLQYAIPGTEYNIYGDGVFVSDKPLGPFHPAENNPYSYKPGGYMRGAGHGSTLKDKDGNFWHMSTFSISKNDSMERRIGLWKAGFDSDGELFCDQRYGDFPNDLDAPAFSEPKWWLLSYGKKVSVSGGDGAENLTDENARTWWKGKPGDSVRIDLGNVMDVRAVQINFADDKIFVDMEKGDASVSYDERIIDRSKKVTAWILDASEDGVHYITLCDKSDADTDFPHDFVSVEKGISARYIRLKVLKVPYGQPCLSGLRVFGKYGNAPEAVKGVRAERLSDLDMSVSWEDDCACHNILWGSCPDKLYHSCMVFGKKQQKIGALIKGKTVYVRVDAINEGGVIYGTEIIELK